jgi:signal transduction histidine kinase
MRLPRSAETIEKIRQANGTLTCPETPYVRQTNVRKRPMVCHNAHRHERECVCVQGRKRRLLWDCTSSQRAVPTAFTPTVANPLPDNIAVRLELDPELPPILGDRGQLAIVFGSLIRNARDAMPDW